MSFYENPFTKRCTCSDIGGTRGVRFLDYQCPVHGDPNWPHSIVNRKEEDRSEHFKSINIQVRRK